MKIQKPWAWDKVLIAIWIAAISFQFFTALALLSFAVGNNFGLGHLALSDEDLLKQLSRLNGSGLPAMESLRQMIHASQTFFVQFKQFLFDCAETLLVCTIAQVIVLAGIVKQRRLLSPVGWKKQTSSLE